jgi:tRNA dimethylallyltransferase
MDEAMPQKVILIVGPTCVGKTAAAVLLARELDTEIISADSMQIYRHMDIGTEKPTPEQMTMVRHHMIDVVEPWETYSAGRYVEAARAVIEGLHRRGRVPVVTGGTGLYIKAMTRGVFKGPAADWALRGRLLERPPGELYGDLSRVDPEAARGIMPGDTRRVVRALEVCLKSGRRISEMRRTRTSPLPYEFVKVALWRDRGELYPMIERRVDEMMGRGLLEEVRRVLAMGPSATAMQAIGYKELAGHIQGRYPLDEAVRLIKRNTKRYAKRQFTWFRKEEALRWVEVTGLGEAREVLERMRPALREGGL